MVLPSFFPRRVSRAGLDLWNRGSGRGEEPGGTNILRLIRIRLATPSLVKISTASQAQSPIAKFGLVLRNLTDYSELFAEQVCSVATVRSLFVESQLPS